MKYIYIIFFSLVMNTVLAQNENETTIFLIRHAEKSLDSNDPILSETGKLRAKQWATYFESFPISLFYSTNYKRTLETCRAVSKENKIILYEPKALDLKSIIKENKGKTILIVGHSNTIPSHINQLLGEQIYKDMEENQFGNLYTITDKSGVLSHSLQTF